MGQDMQSDHTGRDTVKLECRTVDDFMINPAIGLHSLAGNVWMVTYACLGNEHLRYWQCPSHFSGRKIPAATPLLTMPATRQLTLHELGCRLGYQGPRTDNPGLCEKFVRGDLNILQVNIAGISNKTIEMTKTLKEKNFHIAIVQETMLPKKKDITISGYTSYKCKCIHKCQGIMTLIRNDVQAVVKHTPAGDVDVQQIRVWTSNNKDPDTTIYNVYYPPISTTELPFLGATYKKTVIAGDFNAHIPSLGYANYNQRGHIVEEVCNSSNLILLQSKETPPTLLHKAHGTTSRPDLSITSADMIDKISIAVLDDIGSDHRPIHIKLCNQPFDHEKQKRTLWNFKRADWKRFKTLTDDALSQVGKDECINTTYKKICHVIITAAKSCIPRGNVKKYRPFWTKELQKAVTERKKARKIAEKSPTNENRIAYNRLTAKVRKLTKESKMKKWTQTCGSLNLDKEGHKAWRLLNNLQGKKTKKNPEPMEQNGDAVTKTKKKASLFNKHYANVNRCQKRKTLDSILLRQLRKNKRKLPPKQDEDIFNAEFKLSEMETAMKKLKVRKASGPDKIKNEMIRHLGTKGRQELLQFINRTWKENKLPKDWLTATIIPILKPGKKAGEPKSYRPISLTSCIGKLAERMVNSRLYWWLEKNNILNDSQAGFRKGCRTEDQLFRLIQNTVDGFQRNKHTTAVFIDLQQAYDRVWRSGLLLKMSKMGINGNLLKWVQAFLRERTISTQIDGVRSSKTTLEEGLPQGSALSCTLFLIFINDIAQHLPTSINKALFADDLVIWTTDNSPVLSEKKLNEALLTISCYCKFWKLRLNSQKTVYSTFTLSPKVAKKKLNIKLDGENIINEEHPIYLGVQLDQRMTLATHIENIKEKAKKRLNIIKRLASTSWGADKNTLRNLYVGYVRSAMDYGLPFQMISSKNQQSSLDKIQNNALRLICGGMRSSPIAACEIDANIEPYDLRRKRSLIDATERYQRQENDHPNKTMVDTWKNHKRLHRKSLLEVCNEIGQENWLPQNREKESKYSDFPPWANTTAPNIKTTLLDESASKDTPPGELRQAALETINSYPKTAIHVYTDGSAIKATHAAGLGIHIQYPDNSSFDFSSPCGNICSNYEAELQAIKMSVEILHQQFDISEKEVSDINIFTDSKSALEALTNPSESLQKDSTDTAKAIHNVKTTYKIQVSLQWIPGHTNVPGNEIADQLAKKGSSKTQFDKKCSMQTARRILKNNSKEEWLNRWAGGSTGRVMYKEMSCPKQNDQSRFLSRKEQCNIFRLRTQHIQLNSHLNRIMPTHPPLCRNCPHPYETVEHVLLECPGLSEPRQQLLPPHPTLHNTLYTSAPQLRNTSRYIQLALTAKEQETRLQCE